MQHDDDDDDDGSDDLDAARGVMSGLLLTFLMGGIPLTTYAVRRFHE